MFFSTRRIRWDAESLCHWCSATVLTMAGADTAQQVMLFLESVPASNSAPVRLSYEDEKELGFFVVELAKFSFHVKFNFAHDGSRCLLVESHEDYFGLGVTAFVGSPWISVDLHPPMTKPHGRNAQRLLLEMLKTPGFRSNTELLKSLGIRH